ncbi:MAG TPA: HAD family hydrolase, partial [Acidimicrobiales bacterium]
MARSAAIVDVDRTLLTGGPGRTLRSALLDAGVALAPGMLTSQLSQLALQAERGWPDPAVRQAATAAAGALVEAAPYLRPLLDDHRADGDRVVLVSAAPPAIAEPLGELLGAEAVLGPGWAEGRGFLAPVEGPLVWARAKAAAGKAWLGEARMPARRAH